MSGGLCSTLPCTRIQRQYKACLHRREARPSSSFPVVALMTSRAESPTVQLTLKLGAFPGCRASALLMPGMEREREGDAGAVGTGLRRQPGTPAPPAAQFGPSGTPALPAAQFGPVMQPRNTPLWGGEQATETPKPETSCTEFPWGQNC